MKAWTVIGHAYNGAFYHDGCVPSDAMPDETAPIFASNEMEAFDYCDACLSKHLREHPGTKAPLDVYLDENAAQQALSERASTAV